MRIAIFNPYKKKFAAENAVDAVYENIKSVEGLDIVAKSFCDTDEIVAFNPDFILSHSSFTPKFCDIPTYVIFNESIVTRLKGAEDIRSYLVFDGYLTQSSIIAQAIEDMCFSYKKKCNILTFANSRPIVEFKEPIEFSNPKLAYFGSNWEVISGGVGGKKKPRFEELFLNLTADNKADFLELYGSKNGWSWINNRKHVKGEIDFKNPNALLEVYRNSGVGLALSSHDFYKEDIANNRIYEITASGALCIADDLEFYKKNFGDSLLYVTTRNEKEAAEQIIKHMDWVKKNPEEAKKMAKKSHEIFCTNLSAEMMVGNLIKFHKEVLERNYYTLPYVAKTSNPLVSVVIRSGERSKKMVERAINSLIKQSYQEIELVFVLYKNNDELYELAKSYEGKFRKLSIVRSSSPIRSTVILEGIKSSTGEYIALLDDDDLWYPNHLSKIMELFDRKKELDLIYTGRVYKKINGKFPIVPKLKFPGSYFVDLLFDLKTITGNESSYNLGGFGKTDYQEMLCLNHPLHPCFVVKKSSLNTDILADPLLHNCEDLYFTALMYKEGLKFWWMPELTMQMNIHDSNSRISPQEEVEIKNRLALRIHGITSWKELIEMQQKDKEIEKISKKLIKFRAKLVRLRFRLKNFFQIFKKIKLDAL